MSSFLGHDAHTLDPIKTGTRGAKNARVENAGPKNTGVLTYGKLSKQKTLTILGVSVVSDCLLAMF